MRRTKKPQCLPTQRSPGLWGVTELPWCHMGPRPGSWGAPWGGTDDWRSSWRAKLCGSGAGPHLWLHLQEDPRNLNLWFNWKRSWQSHIAQGQRWTSLGEAPSSQASGNSKDHSSRGFSRRVTRGRPIRETGHTQPPQRPPVTHWPMGTTTSRAKETGLEICGWNN